MDFFCSLIADADDADFQRARRDAAKCVAAVGSCGDAEGGADQKDARVRKCFAAAFRGDAPRNRCLLRDGTRRQRNKREKCQGMRGTRR